jgi:ribosomal-protein-alanine N-acetyltransferase
MKIRPGTPDDIPAMRAIAAEASTAGQWTAEQYARIFEPDPPRIVLVIEDGGIQGFLVAAAAEPEWEIENLAVAGPARRRGLGTSLIEHLLGMLRQQGAESVFLEVRERNAVARALYEKWDFVESGRRHRYYSNPDEDAIVYRRTI